MDSAERSSTSQITSDVPSHIQRAGREAASMYARLLSEGYGHRWAEMCALQQPPGLSGTDRSFMENRMNNQQLDAMPRDHAENIVTLAKRAGISVSGKFYAGGLADHRGPADPEAWVSGSDDVKRVAMKRNLSVDGAVKHRGIQADRPKSKPLSERLTKEMMHKERKSHPNMKAGELREMVIAKYGRKVK